MAEKLPYPEWFYGGPYLRVDDPDIDLPRRDPSRPISDGMRRQVERQGVFDGERCVAPFNDANSLEDIVSELASALGYPKWKEDDRCRYPTIQGTLMILIMRVEDRLARTTNEIKRNWFGAALEHLRAAPALFAARRYEEATPR